MSALCIQQVATLLAHLVSTSSRRSRCLVLWRKRRSLLFLHAMGDYSAECKWAGVIARAWLQSTKIVTRNKLL